MEFRIKDVNLQCDEDGLLKIGGYINVTERESEMLFSSKRKKWFKEVMKKGVFERAINNSLEIPLLFEHDWNKKLASTSDNTLELREDNIGLRFDATISDESVYNQVKSGVINSCSFGFRALNEKIEEVTSRLEKRFVSSIELLEVSLVKNPAYVGSLCESRAYQEEMEQPINNEVATEVATEVVGEVVKETIEEVVENVSEEVIEVVKEEITNEETVKETSEDERSLEEIVVTGSETISEDRVKEIVDELIEKKLNDIQLAETEEEKAQEELETVKEIHEEIEQYHENKCMMNNVEVVKLRLELLKLNELKRGI